MPRGGAPEGRAPSRWRRWLVLLAAPFAGLIGVELFLRAVLFGPLREVEAVESLRHPALYTCTDGDCESCFWELLHALEHEDPNGPSARAKLPRWHPLLGWQSGQFHPETYRNRAERDLDGRRPVLLFGSSYFALAMRPERVAERFNAGPLGATHHVLDFAVGGYGLGQVVLLAEQALATYRELDPIVLVGVHLTEDPRRADLTFRQGTKPSFEVVDGELRESPPVALGPDRPTVAIGSYAAALAVHGTGLLRGWTTEAWCGREERVERIEATAAALLQRLAAATDGLETHLLVVDSPERVLAPETAEAPTLAFARAVHASGLTFDSVVDRWHAELRAEGAGRDHLFDPTDNHPNARGAELIVEAMEAAVLGSPGAPLASGD